jgi:hypothetical protein
MFDLVTMGTVDDCAVVGSWMKDACVDDCDFTDVQLLGEIKAIFCTYGGSSGSSGEGSYGSYTHGYKVKAWEVTRVPTGQPTRFPTEGPTPAPSEGPTPVPSEGPTPASHIGVFTAITSTSSRGDEHNAIDGDISTWSWMTSGSTTGVQTITAILPSSCIFLRGVSWLTGNGEYGDLSVRFKINGQTVSGVVDDSDPSLPSNEFTSSPKSSGWHLTAAAAHENAHSFIWPAVQTTQLEIAYTMAGYVHWPIREINPLCTGRLSKT